MDEQGTFEAVSFLCWDDISLELNGLGNSIEYDPISLKFHKNEISQKLKDVVMQSDDNRFTAFFLSTYFKLSYIC